MQFNKMHSSGDCSRWNLRILACGAAIVCALAVSSLRASANSILFTYDYAGQPWLQAEFTDVSSGEVELTLTALNANESINELYFNLNPLLSASSLVFNPPSSTGDDFASPMIQTGTDAFKVDGGGKYDIMFSFQDNTLAQGTVVFDISGISGLTASDFAYLSTECAGGSGPTDSSAISSTSDGSPLVILDCVAQVPDGFATAILLGMGILGLEWFRRNLALPTPPAFQRKKK